MSAAEYVGTVHEPTCIVNERDLQMHPTARIDSFCLVNANGGAQFFAESCLHAGSKVIGIGRFQMLSRSVVCYNATIVTSTADLRYPSSSVVPDDERERVVGDVKLAEQAFVGSGAVIMPDVTIGRAAVVTANSYVDEDVPAGMIRYPDGSLEPRPGDWPVADEVAGA